MLNLEKGCNMFHLLFFLRVFTKKWLMVYLKPWLRSWARSVTVFLFGKHQCGRKCPVKEKAACVKLWAQLSIGYNLPLHYSLELSTISLHCFNLKIFHLHLVPFTLYMMIFFHSRTNSSLFSLPVIDVLPNIKVVKQFMLFHVLVWPFKSNPARQVLACTIFISSM